MDETLAFILAQVCSFVTLIVIVVTIQFNKKSTVLLLTLIANLFYTAGYFFLGSTLGVTIMAAVIFRSVVFYIMERLNKPKNIYALIITELAFVATTVIAYEGLWSILFLVSNILFCYAYWQENPIVLRLIWISASVLTIVYSSLIGGYMNIAVEVFVLSSIAIFFVRLRKEKKKKEQIYITQENQLENKEAVVICVEKENANIL